LFYFLRADIQAQLGVNKKWESCNMDVNQRFTGDWMKNYQDELPDMLASGIRVLIYAGDVDFICNWIGNKVGVTINKIVSLFFLFF
jgi:carboxypeptidase C (cathepsin A)